MARRTNYSFEKHQKESKRKKKQAEKLEKKRLAKEAAKGALVPDGEPIPATTDADDQPINPPQATTE